MKLNKELSIRDRQNAQLTMSQMTLSHEFRAPLTSMLMLLQPMVSALVAEA